MIRARSRPALLLLLLTALALLSSASRASHFGSSPWGWRGGGGADDPPSDRRRRREARQAAKRLAREGRKKEREEITKVEDVSRPGESAVDDYVAAMKEKDDLDRSRKEGTTEEGDDDDDDDMDGASSESSRQPSDSSEDGSASGADAEENSGHDSGADSDPVAVGVKPHPSSKKSNAVGDPDGDDDDDSDTSDFTDEEWDKPDEFNGSAYNEEPQLQVELEVMDDTSQAISGEMMEMDADADDVDDDASSDAKPSGSGGGVGVRLGRGIGRRRLKRNGWRKVEEAEDSESASYDRDRLLDAWMPFLYFPPTPSALEYLTDQSRMIDASSKSRLDRRTLYASLLLEFGKGDKASASPSSSRKFLATQTTQAMQAALAMASQPQWRQSSPRNCGIRLYHPDDKPGDGCTLGMQETMAMAVAHSMGCGMLILDDQIINSVRQKMSQLGVPDSDLKPAALLKSLLEMASEGRLSPSKQAGAISRCMKRDLSVELDDPFDERATVSLNEMVHWENEWQKDIEKLANDMSEKETPLPLLVFLRTPSSNSLLKSKSAMELLIKECTSSDSIHLITLGRGIDSSTKVLPLEVLPAIAQGSGSQGMFHAGDPNVPGFGNMSNNQNASGQNDPDGSRRFNIFLARTTDADGTIGVIGCIAPPEAGNLFPQIMAMQAREKLEQQHEDTPERQELEKFAHLLEDHVENNSHGAADMPLLQYFNASLAFTSEDENGEETKDAPPPPKVVEQALQQTMAELLERLSMIDGDDSPQSSTEFPAELSEDLHIAFAQVLKNDHLRRGITDNLIRAAPALSDPKCQGVMLSVYVPPPPSHANHGQLPNGDRPPGNVGGWFQKMLNNQNQGDSVQSDVSNDSDSSKHKRARAMAAAAAMSVASKSQEPKQKEKTTENKAERNLAKLEAICRPISIGTPPDPVRAKSWESWINRERSAIVFKQNRIALNKELSARKLAIQQHTGTRGAGSPLRQMLSIRPLANEIEEVIKCAVELEAAKSLRRHETPDEMHESEQNLDLDVSLTQLILTKGELKKLEEQNDAGTATKPKKSKKNKVQYIHPSSLEAAISMKCRISPSPVGGLSLSGAAMTHRTRDDISALAQDKHERALVSQVVSPQDIGVTYDMIGGLSEVKELLRQSITYPLKYPHLYSEGIAREAVKGVLLFGPPGTGKTMLAKAVATEGGASFLSVDASSVENKWLGESEKNAKAVFTLARRLAPCVIFIDEVDSLLSSREGGSDDSAHGTLTSVKTTMMSEWDGLNSGTNGNGEAGSDRVVVIGSTNRPFDLDEAVLRRFPRRILVDLPDLSTRKEILEVTLAENRVDEGVNLTQIAERLEGYTGSDIKEVCREAVVQISHEQAKLLDQGFTDSKKDLTEGSLQRLRPVTKEDFESALTKLKRSVSEKGRELARVWEWNDEYGEIKKEEPNRLPHLMNMYL